MNVLYLSAWYPSEKDQMAGLFVKKHAEAVRALGVDVRVWGYDDIPQGWRPDLIQLNVLSLKNAIRTWWLHWKYRAPYILVEHWTAYMPENGQFLRQAQWKQQLLKWVASHAAAIYTVSDMLQRAMQQCGITNARWGHVENIVDACFFEPFTKQPNSRVQLVHVSCFLEPAKNVLGLLRAIKSISAERDDFCLTMIGVGRDWQRCVDYARQLSVPSGLIRWMGELSPIQVKAQLQQSDVLILASKFETYGIPLAEAMVTGIPSIETDSCGLRVGEECGISIPIDDDEALKNAIVYMLDHHSEYSQEVIRRYSSRFSADAVGKQLIQVYEDTVNQ